MTLVPGRAGLDHLIHHNFSINEISSMITVGKANGSVVTRATNSSIFDPVASEYGIHVIRVPQWLQNVQFDRSGSILGDRQRKVPVSNTMEGVNINSLAGIATFLVLILRFVEPEDDIVKDIEDLLQGKYDVVDGGSLAWEQALSVNGVLKRQALPFSLRGLLRNFVNSVIDADAQSPQRNQCMCYMAQLTTTSGSTGLSKRLLRYTRYEHQNVLSFLLRAPKDGIEPEYHQVLHTLSAGAAMAGLAASANGADVIVECVTESGTMQINRPSALPRSSCKSSRIIRLWLKQPPTTIMRNLNAQSGIINDAEPGVVDQLYLPVYGGELEISLYVAQQFECELREEEVLAIWQASIAAGQSATWTCRRGPHSELTVIYADDFLNCDVPFDLARLADGYFNVPRGDRRSRLARRAASVVHGCFKASDYSSFTNTHFHSTANLVMIGIFVGSIKALISNGGSSLRMYAWTAEVSVLLGLIQRCADKGVGLSSFEVLLQAARIWGGLAPRYLNPPRSDNRHDMRRSPDNSAVGIVCPQLILLSNILLDPKSMAQQGIAAGLLSCYGGSSPMLPQDQNSGFIFAANPPYTAPPHALDLSSPQPLSNLRSSHPDINRDNFDGLIFSVEPASPAQGTLGLGLCVWRFGDFMMMLDPSIAMRNLLASRSISEAMEKRTEHLPNRLGAFVAYLKTDVLQWLRCGLSVRQGSCIIDVGSDFEWLVVAAGICPHSLVLCLTSAEDVETALNPRVLFEDGTVIIMCRPHRAVTPQSKIEPRNHPGATFAWCDVGKSKKPVFGGARF